MTSVKIHCELSRLRTGRRFEELHKWIDDGCDILGAEHRSKRHYWNKKDKDYILDQWGKTALEEWLFHIVIDNLCTSYKGNKINFLCFGFAGNGFIHYAGGDLPEKILDKTFQIIKDVIGDNKK